MTRWWWRSTVFPLACVVMLDIGIVYWPEAVLRWFLALCGISLTVIVTWLVCGGVLATLGWWSYARHGRNVCPIAAQDK